MSKTTQFAAEVRERAVRLVRDHEGDHPNALPAARTTTTKLKWV